MLIVIFSRPRREKRAAIIAYDGLGSSILRFSA
jgi:hypothetical protein